MGDESPPDRDGETSASPRSFLARQRDSFHQQQGGTKVIIGVSIGVTTAVLTAIVFGVSGWFFSMLGDDESQPKTDGAASSNAVNPSPATTSLTVTTTDVLRGAEREKPFDVVAFEEYDVSWGFWLDGEMPPPSDWPGPYPDDWRALFDERSGAYDSTWLRLVIDGVNERAATITGAQASKIECRDARPQGHFVQTADGLNTAIGWYFDLGEVDPIAYELLEDDVQGGPFFRSQTISLAPGEVLTVDAKAFAGDQDCQWKLELDVVVDGERSTVVIDDGGEPFRTSGGSGDTMSHIHLPISDGIVGPDFIDSQFWVHRRADDAFVEDPIALYDWSGETWSQTSGAPLD